MVATAASPQPAPIPDLPAVARPAATVAAGADLLPVYALDPQRSAVHFEVLHFGTSTLRGRFPALAGEVRFDPSARRGEVGLRIATAGVDTGIAVFDARLRQPDLLAVQAHPEAFFVARRFDFDGDRLAAVQGEFTLRGDSRPLRLQATRFACGPEAAPPSVPVAAAGAPAQRSGERCGGDFEGELQRSDFGLTLALPLVADRVRLLVRVEAVRR